MRARFVSSIRKLGDILHARHVHILNTLRTVNYAGVKELAQKLDVDDSTIRRDLQTLVRLGNVERVHGGVRLNTDAVVDQSPVNYPLSRAHLSIARAAHGFLNEGGSVVIGPGPISHQLCILLLEPNDVTVYTNVPRNAELLSGNGIKVFLAGGEMRAGSFETSGEATVAYFESVRADWAFVESDGIHPTIGLTLAHPWQVPGRRAMLAAAARRCVIIPSTQFGQRHVGFVADTASADLIITDDLLPDEDLPAFAGRVVRAPSDPFDDWQVEVDRYLP